MNHALHLDVLGNDSDIDSATLAPLVQSGPSHGSVQVNADGSIDYTPELGFVGDDSFVYKASDGQLTSNDATVTIGVTPTSDTFDFSSDPHQNLSTSFNLNTGAASNSSGTQSIAGNNSVITGDGNNTVIGNNNGDTIVTGSGNDTIRGGSGDDVISAGGGHNTMFGGAGHDTFVFQPGGFTDTIADFSPSQDKLDFQGFSGLTAVNLTSQILSDVISSHSAASTIIALDANDHITLIGVTYSQLAALHPFELNV